MTATTLMVISDEELLRTGLTHLLTSEQEFRVLAEVDSGHATDELIRLTPDVVILVADATRPTCLQMLICLRRAAPSARVVVIGRETHHSYVALLLSAGALGYVLAQASPRELFAATRLAKYGRRYIDPKLNDELLALFAHRADLGTKVLSRREEQVFRLLAFGHTLKEIAEQLNVSRKSIETYQSRSRDKLGLRTRADIVRYARETGLYNSGSAQN